MFADDIHLSSPGRYLVALVHYACIFGESPEGKVTFANSGLNREQAAVFQRIAWATVTAEPLTGVLAATEAPRPPKPPEGVTALYNLEYIQGGHERNKLDLYLPEKPKGPMPLIVCVRGGGWGAGSKEAVPAFPMLLDGYAVASINYRLLQHAPFPAKIQDCKAAICWLRAHAKQYRLDPGHIAVMGHSAGGHLVALLGTSAGVKEFEGDGGNLDQSSRVQAVVDWAGPADLWSLFGHISDPKAGPSVLLGGSVHDNKEKALAASPITYVSKHALNSSAIGPTFTLEAPADIPRVSGIGPDLIQRARVHPDDHRVDRFELLVGELERLTDHLLASATFVLRRGS